LNLLEGADEIETKLDLARAYIEMEDTDGAKDILNEIVSEGNPQQRNEAQRLLDTLD
jgi:pilus assembly protein FimV